MMVAHGAPSSQGCAIVVRHTCAIYVRRRQRPLHLPTWRPPAPEFAAPDRIPFPPPTNLVIVEPRGSPPEPLWRTGSTDHPRARPCSANGVVPTRRQARRVATPERRLAHPGRHLGANDAFLLQAACSVAPDPNACIQAGLPVLLGTIYSNMSTILQDLRSTGYRGVLMVVNYYSLDYSDPVQTGFTVAINQYLAAAAAANGAVVADAFTAFQGVAAFAGGKSCSVGLLNAAPANQWTCDVHPSQSGQQLLAQTVARTYASATHSHK
jgi:hypothetical protein